MSHSLPEMIESFIGSKLGDGDQQSAAHARRMLMATSELIAVPRFPIPPEFVFLSRPEHEIRGDFACSRPNWLVLRFCFELIRKAA
jgi:hypothetical protein